MQTSTTPRIFGSRWIAIFVMLAAGGFNGHAATDQIKPTPTPTPVVHKRHHKTPVKNTSDDSATPTPKPSASPIKKKAVKKSSDAEDAATPSPSPAKNKYGAGSKKSADADDEASPTPTPKLAASATPKSSKKKKKKNSDDEESAPTPTPKATPAPTPEETPAPSATPAPSSSPKSQHAGSAPNASLNSSDLAEFGKQPEKVRQLLETALDLTRQNLTYTYGSDDPANGGMDCSGFIYYVLRQNGFTDVPRDASGQYVWVRKAKLFQAVFSKSKDSFELSDLRPGDLLFWTGTYAVQKDPPITHTMIYLGTEKGSHKAVMVGSTDGRSYDGKSRWGVSVFDFKANASAATADPAKKSQAAFIGYAPIPGLREQE
jgi:cell wall-associated NlpC family hydrolase